MKKSILLILIVSFCSMTFGQKIIKGTVIDASDGSTLPGVSIKVQGTTKGTITDLKGNYNILVNADDKVLVFTYIGMETKLEAISGRSNINVTMQSGAHSMDEVVVTALGMKRDAKALSFSQQGVDASVLTEVRDQNLVSSLSGKLAGVQITPPGSATGSARIVIRGNKSFVGNNQPLFVVDGMPFDNGDGSGGVNKDGGLDMGNGASDINPDDIEDISVLKGPNAAALYGSRAANGVVLITTKKAKGGKLKVALNSNTMFSYISQFPNLQNSFGVGSVMTMIGSGTAFLTTKDANGNDYPYPGLPDLRKSYTGGGLTRSWGSPMLGQQYIGFDGKVYSYSPHADNIYDFYKISTIKTNNIALEGGTKENNYRVSFTNVGSNDVIEKQNIVSKNTITARFFNTLAKNLTLDSKVTFLTDDTRNRRYMNGSSYNPIYTYLFMPRSLTLEQLKYYKTDAGLESGSMGDVHNPFWSINETHNEDNKTRATTNFDLSYQFIPGLRLSLKYAKDFFYTKANEFRNKGAAGDNLGYYRETTNMTNNNFYEFIFIFDKQLKDISINSTFGGNRSDFYGYSNGSSISSLKQAGFAQISNSNDYPDTWENYGRKRTNSLYGSASIGYRGWIYTDLTGRNDWSSALKSPYFYPSVGLSWIPTEMLKIPSTSFFGKIRGSYAMVGNDTSPYKSSDYIYYTLGSNNVYNGYKYASLPGTMSNGNLKPEMTTSLEIGADLRFLNNRLNFDLTYYNAVSKNQIVDAQMSPSSGYLYRTYNAGSVRNKGIEISIKAIPVVTKNFSWDASVNFTKNNSMVETMVDGLDRIVLREVWNSLSVVQVGYPYGSLFGRVWKTDNQGRKLVDRANGAAIIEDNHYLGNANPDWLLGVGNRFKYKDFDLYVLLDMKKGGKIFSGSRKKGITAGVFSGDETQRESYWARTVIMGDGGGTNLFGGTQYNNVYYDYDVANAPAGYVPEKCNLYFLPQEIGYNADRFDNEICYDASFVKLRELSVGYSLPKKFIAKVKLTNAHISMVGRNLWILYQNTPKGLDPESALYAGNGQGLEHGGMPPTTTLGFDLKISF